ncbi:hypothetical protein [Hugenholtzia roseola]|uniref:hypothetical protein n=1 Tax=Hugenholtzia roseola TaxID=1002 RepID=UPI0003FE0B59|nr:hypothetical protein [Hugenholtzia roseola]
MKKTIFYIFTLFFVFKVPLLAQKLSLSLEVGSQWGITHNRPIGENKVFYLPPTNGIYWGAKVEYVDSRDRFFAITGINRGTYRVTYKLGANKLRDGTPFDFANVWVIPIGIGKNLWLIPSKLTLKPMVGFSLMKKDKNAFGLAYREDGWGANGSVTSIDLIFKPFRATHDSSGAIPPEQRGNHSVGIEVGCALEYYLKKRFSIVLSTNYLKGLREMATGRTTYIPDNGTISINAEQIHYLDRINLIFCIKYAILDK